MNWMQLLAETYDNCDSMVGYGDRSDRRPLLPICHSTTQAHVDIVIRGDGSFVTAKLITDRNESTTIHPSTESSAGRAGSKPVNHPLSDKLQYIAGDFADFGGLVTSGFLGDAKEPHREYLKLLTRWCESEYGHPKAWAVLTYVKQKRVMADLVTQHVLLVDDRGQLIGKDSPLRDKNEKSIFSLLNNQQDAFVRWIVYDDALESRCWRDRSLWESWIRFYTSDKLDRSMCYVTGEERTIATSHPRAIRREGDGAKLISSNDTSGFTFRGRFVNDQEAFGVALEVSQKAHSALAWLIDRQGYRKDDLAVVAWATSGLSVPQPTDDTFAVAQEETLWDDAEPHDTAQIVGVQFKKRIAGYGRALAGTDGIGIMAFDSATPGRLAITYFRELSGSDYLERIDKWHSSCAWLHRYRFAEVIDKSTAKVVRKSILFIGAPSPSDIAEAAYGTRIDEKLRKATVKRILPCIVDGAPLPSDLTESSVRRASNRVGLENWEWEKVLSIACALYRKQHAEEKLDMPLDLNRTTREYLYGRALALADGLEAYALHTANESRETTAARLMQRFAERPYSTWRTIELGLRPYIARLRGRAHLYERQLDDVLSSFDPDDFKRDTPLGGEFLLGFHSQREALRARFKHTQDGETDSDEATDIIELQS